MRTLLLFSINGPFFGTKADSISKEMLELQVAAGGLFSQIQIPSDPNSPIPIVSREGPTTSNSSNKKSKKKNSKKNSKNDENIPQRGFKTSSLHDAIETWQYKYKDVQDENSKLDKQELKNLVSEGRMLNFKSLLSEVLGKAIAGDDDGADKFCDYGCYCVPLDFSKTEWIGKGEPVDEIDSLCRDLWNCYKCAKFDQGKHCDGQNNYDWYTKVNGKIKCGDKDHNSSCQSEVCNCDLQFANRLKMISGSFSKEFHKEGGFDRTKKCMIKGSDKDNSGNNKQPRPNAMKAECCGTGIQRAPFKPNKSECCADGRIEPIGEC